MSSSAPKLDQLTSASSIVLAPTVMALGADAGESLLAFLPSFPAATTVTIPSSYISCTLTLIGSSEHAPEQPPPSDIETMVFLCVLETALCLV